MAVRKKIDLFFGSLGNGISVADKNREEHGDYKKVAHISDPLQPRKEKKIKYYLKKVPPDIKKTIEAHAKSYWAKQTSSRNKNEGVDYHDFAEALDVQKFRKNLKAAKADEDQKLPGKLTARLINTTATKMTKMTDRNYHTEAVIELGKLLLKAGGPTDARVKLNLTKLEKIKQTHEKVGHMPEPEHQHRRKIRDDLLKIAKGLFAVHAMGDSLYNNIRMGM